jgi:cation:H+ antiporter
VEHLIPTEWFTGQPQWVLLVVAAFAVYVLGKGADWLVDGASGLAYRMGISKVIVGATVVSLGTTSPECAVSVMAAWSGEPGLALGNAIGSIIADSGLIFGLGCLIAVLPADRFVLQRQGWVQFGSGVLLAVICYGAWIVSGDGAVIARWVGIVLLVLLVLYMIVSVRWSQRHPAGEPFQIHEEEDVEARAHQPYLKLIAVGVVGLALVLLASRALIGSVTELAEVHWGVPKVVVAATLVALGTSLPELVIGITSIAKGHHELLVGNVIGADILNVLFVVGASAAAAELPIVEAGTKLPQVALYVHLPTMLAILVLFRLFIFSAVGRGEFRRWYGIPLVALYVGYVVIQYVLTA